MVKISKATDLKLIMTKAWTDDMIYQIYTSLTLNLKKNPCVASRFNCVQLPMLNRINNP